VIVERIKRHNIINGFAFSLVEFAIVALLVGGFSIALFVTRRYPMAWIFLGIALNCFPVMYYAWRSLQRKEKDIGFSAWLNSKTREQIGKDYPQTSVDTTIIVLATLVPFLAVLLTLIDNNKRSAV
jgi:uncharacterized membrane protein